MRRLLYILPILFIIIIGFPTNTDKNISTFSGFSPISVVEAQNCVSLTGLFWGPNPSIPALVGLQANVSTNCPGTYTINFSLTCEGGPCSGATSNPQTGNVNGTYYLGNVGAAVRYNVTASVSGGGSSGPVTCITPDSADACLGLPGPDDDGDGVADYRDQCRGQGGNVDGNGCPLPDRDGDGIPDQSDQCPDDFGASPHGCPDTDGDGVHDGVDSCPNQAGPASNNGCPESDRDGDGIIDTADQCPDDFGNPPHGCPDTDGDGVHDGVDSCPNQAGPASNNGCPVTVINPPTPVQLCDDNDGDGLCNSQDRCPNNGGPASLGGCPDPQATTVPFTPTPTPIPLATINLNVACNTVPLASADDAGMIIRSEPSQDAERLSGFIPKILEGGLPVYVIGTTEVDEGLGDNTWYLVQYGEFEGWVYGGNFAEPNGNDDCIGLTTEIPTTSGSNVVNEQCPQYADAYSTLDTQTRVDYDGLDNPCSVLGDIYRGQLLNNSLDLAEITTPRLLENCALLIPEYDLIIAQIYATNPDIAEEITEEVVNAPDACNYVRNLLENGYASPNLERPTIVSCIRNVAEQRIAEIQALSLSLNIDWEQVLSDNVLCLSVRNLSNMGALTEQEIRFYQQLKQRCGYSASASINLLHYALSLNANLSQVYNQSIGFCEDSNLIERIQNAEQIFNDVPAQITSCEPEFINLFMRILVLPTEERELIITESQIRRVLSADSPCLAVQNFLLRGIIPFVQPPSDPSSPSTSLPAPAAPTADSEVIPEVTAPITPTSTQQAGDPTVTPEPEPPVPPTIAFADELDNSAVFVVEIFNNDTLQNSYLYLLNKTEGRPCSVVNESDSEISQPTEGSHHLIAYYARDLSTDEITLNLTDCYDVRNHKTTTSYDFDTNASIAWHTDASQRTVFVTMTGDDGYGIYQFDFQESDNPEPELVILGGSNPSIVSAYLVYEMDGIIMSAPLGNLANSNRAVNLDDCAQPTDRAHLNLDDIRDYIVFICDNQIHSRPIGEPDTQSGSFPIDDSAQNLSVLPSNIIIYIYDDETSIYYLYPRGTQTTPVPAIIQYDGDIDGDIRASQLTWTHWE